jgi:Tol biopolymer transport system component
MTDMHDRFRSLDRVPTPELWGEATLRAVAEPQAGPETRTNYMLPFGLAAAALLLALAIGGAVLVGSGVVEPPVLPDSSNPRLVYALEGDIYLADWDGTNPVLIAQGLILDGNACAIFAGEGSMWSPDGRHFAYRSGWGRDGCTPLVEVRDAQGNPVGSFPGEGWEVSWSPDSTRIADWITWNGDIGIYAIDGQRLAVVPLPASCQIGEVSPGWSLDGNAVVTTCELPIDGETARPLPLADPRSSWDWVYSPDGERVAYVSALGANPLVMAEADGIEIRALDHPPGVRYHSPVWSPSGDQVAFTASPCCEDGFPNADSELRMVSVATGQVTTLAAEPGVLPLRFSPDGDRVLFRSDAGLSSVDTDGSNDRLLIPGADWGDWQPLPPSPSPTTEPPTSSSPAAADPPVGTYFCSGDPSTPDVTELWDVREDGTVTRASGETGEVLPPGTWTIDTNNDVVFVFEGAINWYSMQEDRLVEHGGGWACTRR